MKRPVIRPGQSLALALALAALLVAVAIIWNKSTPDAGSESGTHAIPPRTDSDGRGDGGMEKVPAEPGDPALALLISPDTTGFDSRDEACRTLPPDLERSDQALLAGFAFGSAPSDMSARKWHALFNSILNRLRHQETPPPSLTRKLLDLVRSEGCDPVLRDYAVQHLAALYTDRPPLGTRETDPALRGETLAAIKAEAKRPASAHAGTALLALNHIVNEAAKGNGEPWSPGALREFENLCISLIRNGGHFLSRMSALQVCSRRGLAEALPEARNLVADEKTPPALRTSAIAVLGSLGDRNDLPILQSLADQEGRYALAAGSARKKIKSQ